MPSINIPFPDPINTSVQVGDIVYAIAVAPAGAAVNSFNKANLANGVEIGWIWQITNQEGIQDLTLFPISIDVMQTGAGICGAPPCFNIGDFIMFSKNKAVNTSGIKGYYAEATFKNRSLNDIELFSVGTGIAISSS